jgi:Zn-dependent protease with chaperone function
MNPINPSQFDRFADVLQGWGSRIHVRSSALNPALWLCAIVLPVCFVAAYWFRDDHVLVYILIGLGSLPILLSIGGFIYFAIKQPERLQSEDYQIRHESLQLIQQKSVDATVIPYDAINAIATANPPALSHKEREEGK